MTVIDIRAAVATDVGKPFVVRTVQLRPPRPDEVMVRLAATGLCHTDLTVLEGQMAAPFPLVLGHEGSGVIESCGADVAGLSPGDHVVLSSIPECGRCRGCGTAHTNYCDQLYPDLLSPDTPLSMDGKPLARFATLGTFAEKCVVKATHVAKVRKDAPLGVLCVLGCAVATGVGSALETAQVTPGSTVIVIGLGGIGLNVVQGARLAGAARIIGVDVSPAKGQTALSFGMTDFVEASDELADRLMELTAGGGDFVFECAGHAHLQQIAFAVTHAGWGVCTMVGVPPADHNFVTGPNSLISGKTIRGSSLGGIKVRSGLPELVDWYVEGRLQLDALVSHRLTLDQINEGYDLMREGQTTRAIIEF